MTDHFPYEKVTDFRTTDDSHESLVSIPILYVTVYLKFRTLPTYLNHFLHYILDQTIMKCKR